MTFGTTYVYKGHSTFRVVWVTSAKSGLHAGNVKLNTQNKKNDQV